MSDIKKLVAQLPPARRAEFLARLRGTKNGCRPDSVTRYATHTEAPLTQGQRTLWFIEQLVPGKATYHLALNFRLHGRLDVEALRRALAAVVERQAAMRTRFENRPDGPVQIVEPRVPVNIAVLDVDGAGEDVLEQALRRATREVSVPPFAFDQAPLWRARLYRLGEDDHLFTFVIHHIVFDGVSVELLRAELAAFYRAETAGEAPDLPGLPVQYTDFALWQQERLADGHLERIEAYWRNQLSGAPALELPTDRPRPAEVSFRGSALARKLRPGLGSRTRELARAMNTTAYVVYLGAFWAMLQQLSHSDDIVVGASVTGRDRPELASLFGLFVNVIALRGRLAPRASFRQIVMEADRVVRDGLAHADISFEQIVRAVQPDRDLSRSPIFQISLLVTADAGDDYFGDVRVEPVYRSHGTARFDMAWAIAGADDITTAVEYSTDLYDASTVEWMIDSFESLLDRVLADPDRALADPGMRGALQPAVPA